MGGPAMEQLADRERMNTAMWHLQVFAGFFLKRTGSTDQSIQYLTRMTRALEETVLVRPATRLLAGLEQGAHSSWPPRGVVSVVPHSTKKRWAFRACRRLA